MIVNVKVMQHHTDGHLRKYHTGGWFWLVFAGFGWFWLVLAGSMF